MPKAAGRILFMSFCVIAGCNVGAGVAMPQQNRQVGESGDGLERSLSEALATCHVAGRAGRSLTYLPPSAYLLTARAPRAPSLSCTRFLCTRF